MVRMPALGIVLDLGPEYGSSQVLRHWLPIHQMLRSTVSNKNLTFCIRAMVVGFDKSLMSSSVAALVCQNRAERVT